MPSSWGLSIISRYYYLEQLLRVLNDLIWVIIKQNIKKLTLIYHTPMWNYSTSSHVIILEQKRKSIKKFPSKPSTLTCQRHAKTNNSTADTDKSWEGFFFVFFTFSELDLQNHLIGYWEGQVCLFVPHMTIHFKNTFKDDTIPKLIGNEKKSCTLLLSWKVVQCWRHERLLQWTGSFEVGTGSFPIYLQVPLNESEWVL